MAGSVAVRELRGREGGALGTGGGSACDVQGNACKALFGPGTQLRAPGPPPFSLSIVTNCWLRPFLQKFSFVRLPLVWPLIASIDTGQNAPLPKFQIRRKVQSDV